VDVGEAVKLADEAGKVVDEVVVVGLRVDELLLAAASSLMLKYGDVTNRAVVFSWLSTPPSRSEK
jgi:hypothetical protein